MRRWTGLPTCVGIGPTKTLAKLANHIAKSIPELGGVCDLSDEAERAAWMVGISVGEVWGSDGPPWPGSLRWAWTRWPICATSIPGRRGLADGVGERIIHELRGRSCLPLEIVPARRKGLRGDAIVLIRITQRAVLEQAVAAHATRLGEKLAAGWSRRVGGHGVLPHQRARPRRPHAVGFNGRSYARGDQWTAGT